MRRPGQIMRFLTKRPIQKECSRRGFTLVEVTLSIALLGLLAVATSHIYSSGLEARERGQEYALWDSAIRSRMEQLLAERFDQLNNGHEEVTVNGKQVTIRWTVNPVNLDDNPGSEPDARRVKVFIENRAIDCIFVYNAGKVKKI
jgi:prepilin-type N-terminal cleavage/methylation domain-containing protein